jgi:glyoxylase-like metal-dependent hydrolase (beta-lactamase superfamily II)
MKERAIKIAPHIYMFHAPLSSGPAPLANEMLIEQTDGLVLVDAGKTRGAGERIVALIRSISSKPVKAVIITHCHPDHVLGLGPIVEAWPKAAIVESRDTLACIERNDDDSYKGIPRTRGGSAERDQKRAAGLRAYAAQLGPNLTDPKLSAAERRGWADVVGVLDQRIADERGTYLVMPTVTFTDTYKIDDPLAPVEARFLGRAHTDGDVVVWAPRQRVVATGDVVVWPIPFTGSRVFEWPGTLRAIERLRPLIVVPGHGVVLRGTAYIERMAVALTAFGKMAEGLLAGPEIPDDQVLDKIGVSAQKQAFAGNDPWRRLWFDQYFAVNVAKAYRELRAKRVTPQGTGKP